MSSNRTRIYSLVVSGKIADYCLVPLQAELFSKWKSQAPQFYEQTILSDDDDRDPELSGYRDFPGTRYFEGIFVEGGIITLFDQVSGIDHEIDLEQQEDDLDWDDFIELNEGDAYGLAQNCALFETPYSGEITYEIKTRARFDPAKLMFFASRFDEDSWFVSSIFYEGRELPQESGSGSFDYNKVSMIEYNNGNGKIVSSFSGSAY